MYDLLHKFAEMSSLHSNLSNKEYYIAGSSAKVGFEMCNRLGTRQGCLPWGAII